MYKDLREPFRPPETEEIFNMMTKETPKTFYVGKLVEARVSGFAYKRPQSDELDKAAPQRKGEGNMWQCPFCGQDDFPELTEVLKAANLKEISILLKLFKKQLLWKTHFLTQYCLLSSLRCGTTLTLALVPVRPWVFVFVWTMAFPVSFPSRTYQIRQSSIRLNVSNQVRKIHKFSIPLKHHCTKKGVKCEAISSYAYFR